MQSHVQAASAVLLGLPGKESSDVCGTWCAGVLLFSAEEEEGSQALQMSKTTGPSTSATTAEYPCSAQQETMMHTKGANVRHPKEMADSCQANST